MTTMPTSAQPNAASHTIGGVTGAPPAYRAKELTGRATGGADNAPKQMTSPFTGKPTVDLPQATDADARKAFDVARQAQRKWAKVPAEQRQEVVSKLVKLILARQEEALDLIQVECGKSRVDAFDEISAAALAASYYGRNSAKFLSSQRRAGALPVLTQTTEVRHPKGVVGIVTPWNYPLALTALDVLPALAAGNAVIQKPDNQTSLAALWLHELAEEAGLPQNVWQIVLGRGSVIGDALAQESDYFAFTGSTETGKALAGKVAPRLINYSMELGGKNPMIVLPDANIDKTVSAAMSGCFSSAGQLCVSAERIYVHESIREEFTEKFAAKAKALKLGAGLDYSADLGSLTSKAQLDTVIEHVEDARAKGATILAGGKARPEIGPLFYEPTVLTDVTADMKPFAEETFGLVVSIYGYNDVNDAIERANDTAYGLNASVWTKDVKRGREIAQQIHAGTVNVNEAFAATFGSVDAPMGGFGESGVGRRNGREGLLRYTEVQTIATQHVTKLRGFDFVPASVWTKTLTQGIKALRLLPRR